MKQKKPSLELTKAEMRVIIDHMLVDLSYGNGGTFWREDETGESVFDDRAAKIAYRAIEKLRVRADHKPTASRKEVS